MSGDGEAFVAFDTAKEKNAVAIAVGDRTGEVRYFGEIDNTPEATRKLVMKLATKYGRLHFCYEAGPTGYGLHRQIVALGHPCMVVAPSLIPKRPGDRVKTNRRDAVTLAKLLRAGELTAAWVPDATHEAIRDLSRAREAAVEDLRRKRQLVSAFLLRHGRSFPGKSTWGGRHARWLAGLTFEHPAQRIVLQEALNAVTDAVERLARLEAALAEIVPGWTMAPVVAAFQAMRGVDFINAVTIAAEIGDLRRFDSPRQVMSYLGLVPSERSTGETVKRGGDHQDRQPAGQAGSRRRGVDLPLRRQGGQDATRPCPRSAEDGARHRLEGATAPLPPVSHARRTRQAQHRRHHGDRQGNGGVPLGDRPRGPAAGDMMRRHHPFDAGDRRTCATQRS
jgi:transposase